MACPEESVARPPWYEYANPLENYGCLYGAHRNEVGKCDNVYQLI